MATKTEDKSVVYQISVRGPNGEEEKFNVSSEDSAAILRNRILMSPRFAVFTAFHFEVENARGGEDLYLDDYVPFSQIPVIGNGTTILLVTDLYDSNSIRYQIKRSIALLTNKVPQISQLVSLNNDEVPDSLKEYVSQMGQRAKDVEEKKQPQPLNLKIRVNESAKENDKAFKEFTSGVGQEGKSKNLEEFLSLFDIVNEEQPVAIKSLSLSSYNPPSPSRRAMGDLIYLRMHTAENNVMHITGSVSGFFANSSSDSQFNPERNSDYHGVYPTLPAVLSALSSGFKQWYQRFRQNARSSNMAAIIRSLPLLPSLECSSKGWFAAEEKDSTNLFDYADVMMSDSVPIAMLKSKQDDHWMADYNIVRTSNLSSEMKTSLVLTKEQGFAAAAVKTVKAIVDEGLPFQLADGAQSSYMVNGIFLTYVNAESTALSISDCNDEVNCIRTLNALHIDDLFTCLTACIDYKGHRYLAQSAVPGIMNMSPSSMMLWGSIDNGVGIYTDSRVKPIVEKIASQLHWAPSQIYPQPETEPFESLAQAIAEPDASQEVHKKTDECVEFLGPVEGRIVRGGDNRLYAVDFLHMAPVDVHWKEAHAALFPEEKTHFSLRRAIVVQWLLRKQALEEQVRMVREAIEKRKESSEKDEKSEEKSEESEKVEEVDPTRLAEVEKELAETPDSFDPNAFTPFCKPGCASEGPVRQLSVLLTESLLPKLKESMLAALPSYAETSNLVTDLHGASINARYLGELASSCGDSEAEQQLKELCEEEMVARGVKHVLRELLSNEVLSGAAAFVTTVVLNSLLCGSRKKEILLSGKGKKSRKVPSLVAQTLIRMGLTAEAFWDRLEADIQHHYHYTLALWGRQAMTETQRFRLLRRVCAESGVRLQAIRYNLGEDYAIRVENILEFVPRVKFAMTTSIDETCAEMYQTILLQINSGNFAVAYELAKQSFLQLISAHSQLHPQMLSFLDIMATILTSVNDFQGALPVMRASLYCSDVIYGKDSIESAKRHTQLASLLYRNNAPYEALLHNEIAVRSYGEMNGEDCEEAKQIQLNLGMCYMLVQEREKALQAMNKVMTLKDKSGDDYLNAAFYATVLNAALKRNEEVEKCKQLLVTALESKSEEFKKEMLDNLEKQLKELH